MLNRKNLVAIVATSTLMLCVTSANAAQASRPARAQGNVPMLQDWTTGMVGFRNPMTPEEAKARGPAQYQRWQRLASDPRFMLSLQRKFQAQADAADAAVARAGKRGGGKPPPATSSIVRDWKAALGGNLVSSGAGQGDGEFSGGMYPAKYNFNINATPDCAGDFVVYPTSSMGSTANGADTVRTSGAYANNSGALTVTVALNGRQVTLTGSTASANSGTSFTTTTNGVTNAANLAAAINRWSGTTSIHASSNATGVLTATVPNAHALVSVTSSAGAILTWNANPAVVAGEVAGQPSLLAYNQLYNTTCAAGRTNSLYPNVFWSYNTGGSVVTSPVLSYFDNAQQVAFIQSNGSAQAELVLLKWKSGSGSAARPAVPALAATAADYRNGTGLCAGGVSCMYKIAFSGTPNDTTSSPFVDYYNDVLYVGAANGTLHKFTGVFAGSPAEVTSGGFPSMVSSGNALGSAVYDFNGSVFVGSTSAVGSGGALHKVNASNGAVTSSAKLSADVAATSSAGVRAAPMLDVSAGKVFAFVYNGAGGTTPTCSTAPCREVYQFDTGAGFPGTPVRATPGRGNSAAGVARVFWDGAFDSAWYNSADSTGSIYVCGGSPGDFDDVTLWKLSLTAGVMSATAVQGATVGLDIAADTCSPMGHVQSGSNEYLYVGVPDLGTDNGTGLCSGTCMYMYNLADLQAASSEVWTFNFGGNQTTAGGSLVVNGVTFTAVAGASACTAAGGGFTIAGNANADGAALRACAALVPGFTTSGSGTQVIISRNGAGNVSDSLVAEGVDLDQLTGGVSTQGINASDWRTSNLPRAGLPIGTGGSGGIIIDNLSANPGNSQVYFGTIASPGVGVQASQSGLQ